MTPGGQRAVKTEVAGPVGRAAGEINKKDDRKRVRG